MEPKYIVKRADLEYNIRVLRNLAKGKAIWGVVKGNGYGLGIVPLARILNDCGVDHLAVASLAEARTLREAGFTENPILMLRGSADPQEVEELLKLGVTLSLGSREDYFTLMVAGLLLGGREPPHSSHRHLYPLPYGGRPGNDETSVP